MISNILIKVTRFVIGTIKVILGGSIYKRK